MNARRTFLSVSAASLLLGALGIAAVNYVGPARADNLLAQVGTPGENTQPGRPHRGDRLAAAAERLGVSETELRTALGLPEQPIEPDFAGAAAQLGTTETELKDALRMAPSEAGERGRRPDFAAVAGQYGVSEAELKSMLGLPAERPEPDIAAAAAQLGVSEDEIRDALRGDGNCRGEGMGPEAPPEATPNAQ